MRLDPQTYLDDRPRDPATDTEFDARNAPKLEYALPEESQTAGWVAVWLICGGCSIVLGLCLLILFVLGWK